MERKLLLLGLLRSQEMHGYQLNAFIDRHLGARVLLKQPTAYRLLNKMAADGWVTCTEEREGNRPPRRVFSITPAGEEVFQQLLRERIAEYQPMVYAENIGLLFLDALPSEEALELLGKRRASVEGVLQEVGTHEVFEEASSLLLMHQERHLATELEWLDEVIALIDQSDDDGELTGGRLA